MAVTKGNIYNTSGVGTTPTKSGIDSTSAKSLFLIKITYNHASAITGTPTLGGVATNFIDDQSETGIRIEYWYRYVSGSLAAAALAGFTLPASVPYIVEITEIIGEDAATQITSSGKSSATGGSEIAVAGVTTGVDNDYVEVSCAWLGDSPTLTAGTGYTAEEAQITQGVSLSLFAQFANAQTPTASTLVTPPVTDNAVTGPSVSIAISIKQAFNPAVASAPVVSSVTTTGSSVNPGALTQYATSVDIQIATDAEFSSIVQTIPGATPSGPNAVTGLTAGTDYYYRSIMKNANGNTNGTGTSVTPTLCGAPTGLVVSAVALSTSLKLDWVATTGADTYNIYKSLTNGSGYSLLASGVATNTYTDTAATPGVNNYYVIRAVNESGSSNNSSQGTGITLAKAIAPTSITATPGNAQVSIGFVTPTGAASINVYRSTSIGSGYAKLTLGTAYTGSSPFVDTTAVNGTTYYYELSSTNATGEGPLSSTTGAETPPGAAPTSCAASYNSGTHSIDVTWSAPTESPSVTPDGYYVYRKSNSSVNGVAQKKNSEVPLARVNWGTTSYTDKACEYPAVRTGGNIYTYYISTITGNQEGLLSAASSPVTYLG